MPKKALVQPKDPLEAWLNIFKDPLQNRGLSDIIRSSEISRYEWQSFEHLPGLIIQSVTMTDFKFNVVIETDPDTLENIIGTEYKLVFDVLLGMEDNYNIEYAGMSFPHPHAALSALQDVIIQVIGDNKSFRSSDDQLSWDNVDVLNIGILEGWGDFENVHVLVVTVECPVEIQLIEVDG